VTTPAPSGAPTPATYALIHGAGDVGWYWHLDLPVDDDAAGLSDYTDAVVDAVGDRGDVVVVGHSFGAYVAPLVCARVPARLLVLVAPMIPAPGETANDMFADTGYGSDASEPGEDRSERAIFYHDVDPALAAEALSRGRPQSETPGREPWPLPAWPRVPTRCLVCRDDRLFSIAWLRRVARDRLGVTPDEMDGGHTPALSRPAELARRLEAYRAEVWGSADAAREGRAPREPTRPA
jgi:pimeloyl-ACP methyl ester carboxylesterase